MAANAVLIISGSASAASSHLALIIMTGNLLFIGCAVPCVAMNCGVLVGNFARGRVVRTRRSAYMTKVQFRAARGTKHKTIRGAALHFCEFESSHPVVYQSSEITPYVCYRTEDPPAEVASSHERSMLWPAETAKAWN